jgi:hypothetical protein
MCTKTKHFRHTQCYTRRPTGLRTSDRVLALPSTDPSMMSSSPRPVDAAAILSAESTLALREAFRRHLAEPSDRARADVTAALGRVCTEARREQIPAERLLVAFKGIWSSLPEVRQLPPHEAAAEVRNLVTLCIERYYAPE